MFNFIYKIWRVSDNNTEVFYDYILVISYSSSENELSVFSKSCMEILEKYLPHKSVILSIFSKKNREEEKGLKTKYFKGYEDQPEIIYATSSTDECSGAMQKMKPDTKVLIICEGCHSRRLRLVWKYMNQKYKKNLDLVFVSTNDKGYIWDKNNPMPTQKSRNIWLIINIVLYVFYKILGVKVFEKLNFSQPV